jgi:hypothetical protein
MRPTACHLRGCHTSHVTRHTSHVTRHTSPGRMRSTRRRCSVSKRLFQYTCKMQARHTSHFTCHTSRVQLTWRISSWNLQSCCFTSVTVSSSPASTFRPRVNNVTRHTSHVTRHTSHSTRHTSHSTRHTSNCNEGPHLHLVDPELALYSTHFAHDCAGVGDLHRITLALQH